MRCLQIDPCQWSDEAQLVFAIIFCALSLTLLFYSRAAKLTTAVLDKIITMKCRVLGLTSLLFGILIAFNVAIPGLAQPKWVMVVASVFDEFCAKYIPLIPRSLCWLALTLAVILLCSTIITRIKRSHDKSGAPQAGQDRNSEGDPEPLADAVKAL